MSGVFGLECGSLLRVGRNLVKTEQVDARNESDSRPSLAAPEGGPVLDCLPCRHWIGRPERRRRGATKTGPLLTAPLVDPSRRPVFLSRKERRRKTQDCRHTQCMADWRARRAQRRSRIGRARIVSRSATRLKRRARDTSSKQCHVVQA